MNRFTLIPSKDLDWEKASTMILKNARRYGLTKKSAEGILGVLLREDGGEATTTDVKGWTTIPGSRARELATLYKNGKKA